MIFFTLKCLDEGGGAVVKTLPGQVAPPPSLLVAGLSPTRLCILIARGVDKNCDWDVAQFEIKGIF